MLDDVKIKDFCSADLGRLESLFTGSGSWTDALAHFELADGPRALLPRDSWNAYIHRRLGHLAVNPSRKPSTDALNASYVFPPTVGVHRGRPANESENTALRFVESLIELAKDQRELWADGLSRHDPVEDQLSSTNLTLLIGPRGSGKTFFFNYLLSRHNTLLNDSRVVWVRLDLTQKFFLRPEELTSLSIEDWVFAQATKILYRYYDASSIYSADKPIVLNIDDMLQRYIEKLNETNDAKESLNEKRRKMRELFPIVRKPSDFREAASAEAPLSQNLVPSDMGLSVVNYALSQGYAFIVVFDGLDVLDCSLQEHLTYLRYNAAVQRLARDHGRTGMTYVASIRMHDGAQQYQSQYNVAPECTYYVAPVSLDMILKKRMSFIGSEAAYISNLPQYPPALDLEDHLKGFMQYLEKAVEEGGRARFFPLLCDVLGSNSRAQMQVTRMQYADYCSSEGTKQYRILEALVTEDGWVPPRRFEYKVDPDGWLVPFRVGERRFDNRLLPTLFRFPLEAERLLQGNVSLNGDYVVANLRILQLALAPTRTAAKKPGGTFPNLTVAELADLLFRLFGYDRKVVYGLVQELSEYELIWLSGYSHASPASVDRAIVHPLPKSEWLLKVATGDVAFLNLAAMRCPFRAESMGEKLFRGRRLPDESRRDELNKWIITKVTNALVMLRIIMHFSTRQGIKVTEWLAGEGREKKYGRFSRYVQVARDAGMLNEIKAIEDVLPQIKAIVTGITSRQGASVASRICDEINGFVEKWG